MLALLLAACGQGGPSALNANTALTPTTHTFFPIATGVHAVDCNTCHGGFSSFAEFTCFNCHAHDQATTDPIHTGVNGYSYASTACYGCHANPTQIASPASVVHDAARDLTANALIPTYAGTSIASLSPQSETLVMGMDHATSELPGVNMASCAVCHAGAASGAYYPGTLHSSLANAQLPEPTACADCHTPSRPTGFVGPVAASPARTPPSGEMKHDAVAWADGVPTGTALVTSDCGTCHASPSATLVATWDTARDGTSPALFHASLTSASVPQPGSCLDCHANTRPSAVLTAGQAALPANVTFDHAAAPALADCASCHAESASSQWKSWTGGRFHLAGSATPSSCLPCHAGERPTSTAA
ncbi:MAG TPA: hypothetical protein VMG32_07110, partial [Anaeromyxobacteraceae bacterium]|nr:hypothetical protein [Anaeromyxobacteraceae bacterium]